MQTLIGVDIGGTQLRAARFDIDLNMLARVNALTHAEEGAQAVLARLWTLIESVLPEDRADLIGIGIGSPGPLDSRTGTVITAPNLPFRDLPLRTLARERFACPAWVGNDADVAGLAEYTRGAGRGARTMVYLTISTGIGAGLVVDGRLLIGAGMGGEVGHMVVDPNGPLCGCGRQGHLEAFSSGTGIARQAREAIAAGQPSILIDLAAGRLDAISARMVGEAARQGDPLSLGIIRSAGWNLGASISALMTLLNPDIFVLGGGVTRIGDLLFDPMHEAIRHYTITPRYYEQVAIVLAQLGEDVGLIGAAALVLSHRGEQ